MKRIIKILLGAVALLFLALLLIPIFFKERIKAMIIREFENVAEATIYFDFDQFDISLIKNFPNATVSLGDFGIIGTEIFAGDTLAHVGKLEVTTNLKKLLMDQEMGIKNIHLNEARIIIIVLEGGKTNYDIIKPSIEDTPESPEEGVIDFAVENFSLSNSDFAYVDLSSSVVIQFFGIDIQGKGDLSTDIFDLTTKGNIADVSFTYDQVEYLSNKKLTLDMVLNMDMQNSAYSFKKNQFLINEFPLKIDGEFAMIEDGYKMDIGFSSPTTDFKNIFSLIPGAYSDNFDKVDASGKASFNGNVNGIYKDDQLPAFNLNLLVENAKVQYPNLPESLNNISLNLAINNSSGVNDETSIDLKELHVDFGNNPFDASLQVLNLKDFDMKGEIQGNINLSELNRILPFDDLKIAGQLIIDARANGKYDSLKNTIPHLNIAMEVKNGWLQTAEIPFPIEDIIFKSKVINTSGKIADTKLLVEEFKMIMDDQPFEATAIIENLDNPKWQITSKGDLDLGRIMSLYPIEGISVKGLLKTDIKSSGSMADLEAKRYQNLPTSGSILLTDFEFKDESAPHVYEVKTAKMEFSTKSIKVENFQGKAGETAYTLNGNVSNYLGFVLDDDVLIGELDVKADILNINEWMTSESIMEDEPYSDSFEVIRLPRNVSFVFNSKIDQVAYSDLLMHDITGKFVLNDGVLDLNPIKFNALDGAIEMKGKYDSRTEMPSYDFGFDVKNISIPSASSRIAMVRKMAPVTENMKGLFNMNFAISGLLNQDMMPDYTSITGKGIVEILQASLGQSEIISKMSSVTNLANYSSATIDKVKTVAEIKDGRFIVRPFKLKLGTYVTQVAGSTGIDGSLDYVLNIDIPANQVTSQLNGVLASLTNKQDLIGSDLRLDLGLKGLYTDPKVVLTGIRTSDGSSVGAVVTASIKNKVEDKQDEVENKIAKETQLAKDSAKVLIDSEVNQLKDSASIQVNAQLDSLAGKMSEQLGTPKDSLSKELNEVKLKVEGVIKGLFKKKKGN